MVVLEGGDGALCVHQAHQSRLHLAEQFLIVHLTVVLVVLFQGQAQFPWPNGRSAIHKGIRGFGLDQELIYAIEHWLHVHDLQIPFEVPVLLHFLPLLDLQPPHLLCHLGIAYFAGCLLWLEVAQSVEMLVVLLDLVAVFLEALLGNNELVLVSLIVQIPDNPQDLQRGGVYLLVHPPQHHLGVGQVLLQLLQEWAYLVVPHLEELVNFLHVGLEVLEQPFLEEHRGYKLLNQLLLYEFLNLFAVFLEHFSIVVLLQQ